MVFTSISFLYYFLPIVLLIYFLVPQKFKNIVLLFSSLTFYFIGEPKYIILLILEIIISFYGTILMDKKESKDILYILIFIQLLILAIFKYTNFIFNNINSIFNTKIDFISIVLPIGISFYTFQIISYEIDVYRKNVKVQKKLLNYMTYVTLFPQLIAGPIVRYETIEKELSERKHTLENISNGIRRFIFGLSKKVLIANLLGEVCLLFNNNLEKTILLYWLNAISYMLQIYFDFSAYSDMAIGLGKIFGFQFLENFNYPYISKSITEFWRRWHISLGTWFRDYVYIPLGGNRKKQVRNILIVWCLTGIWHGASWNFVIWGVLFGIILLVEKLFLKKYLDKIPNSIKRIYTLFIVMISFIIFSSNNMLDAINNIIGLFNIKNGLFDIYSINILKNNLILIIISIILSTPLLNNLVYKMNNNKRIHNILNILEPIILICLLIISTAYIIDSSYNPFLYFRFKG